MAGKALWKGYIKFGEITLPVKLHAAVKEERIHFHLLHRRDRVKLRQQMICAYEDAPVPAEDQVKGFEVEEGRYIIVDPEELERADPQSSKMVEVHEFVRTRQIAPLFLERVYCLGPDAGAKGYTALAETLQNMDAAGICTWVMRKRYYLGALQAKDGVLRLTTLRHADEVIPARALDLPDIPLSEKELKIGSELITQLTAPFQPSRFEDEHQKKLQLLIGRKARGEKIVLLRPARRRPTAPDKLLQTLEASLKKVA